MWIMLFYSIVIIIFFFFHRVKHLNVNLIHVMQEADTNNNQGPVVQN